MGTTYEKPTVAPAWGETAANPADIITMSDADVSIGWPLSGTPPSRQRFNYVLNWATNAIRYFMQRGLSDYDAAETYSMNSVIIGDDGKTYKSIVDGNIGNQPSNHPNQWAPWGLTLAQINASQLTQANVSQGDSTTKVANTNFVTTGLAQLSATITTAYNNAIAAAQAALNASINTVQANLNAVNTTLTNSINTVQTNLNNAVATLNQKITDSVNTAVAAAMDQVEAGMSMTLAQNGHFRLPTWASGLQICWGVVNMPGSSSSNNPTGFNFETAFPNTCFVVVPGTYGGTDRITFIESFTRFGGTMSNNGSGVSASYIAVGH